MVYTNSIYTNYIATAHKRQLNLSIIQKIIYKCMNLCIMGDSWGARRVTEKDPPEHATGYDPQKLIVDQLCEQCGHTVLNISKNGASNFGQLRTLKYDVLEKKLIDFDYIIWFFIEPVRDFTEFISLNYNNPGDEFDGKIQFPNLSFTNFYADIEYLKFQNFKYAQELYNCFKIPFILIGGAGPVGNIPDEFNFVHWKLNSWNQELSGLDIMPDNLWLHHIVKMLDYGNYKRAEALEEIKKIEKLNNIMFNNKELYSDKFHPSINLYEGLIERILMHL